MRISLGLSGFDSVRKKGNKKGNKITAGMVLRSNLVFRLLSKKLICRGFLGVWTILIGTGLAVLHRKDKENYPADEWESD